MFSSLPKGIPDLTDPVEHKKHTDVRHTHGFTQVLQTNDLDKWVSLQQECFQLCIHFTAQCKCNDALQSILPTLEIWKCELLMMLQFLKLSTSPLSILWMNQSMKIWTEHKVDWIQSQGINKAECYCVSEWMNIFDFRSQHRWACPHSCQLFWKPNSHGHV